MTETIKVRVAFTLAEGGHSPLLYGDEGTQGSPRLVKRGFTLTEVLITLGIIGVVAAVTLPTLIHNYRKSVVESKVKKTYALIANAVRMSEAKYGEIAEWDRCNVEFSYECSRKILEKYIFPELSISKVCEETNKEECWTSPKSILGMAGALNTTQSDGLRVTAILDNGMSLCMWAGAQLTSPHIQIWFDIDGPKKGQNMLGADVFGIQTNFTNKGFSFMAGFSRDRDKIINTDRYGCSKDLENAEHYYDRYAGYYCGGLIQRNNWKIPDDYPVKF